MDLATAMQKQTRLSRTANGATCYNTTGDAVLDMFGSVGSLRTAEKARIERIFAEAYMEDPLLATKCLFYARDVRGGMGERQTFRTLLRYAAVHNPEAIRLNIPLIGFYGRYDDLYQLVGTPVEEDMWKHVKEQLDLDEKAMAAKKPCSLLAKWLKTPDASSANTRKLGILTATKLGMSVYVFKRKLRALRKYMKVVETMMSSNKWGDINYAGVPSKAMTLYRKAFDRHDKVRWNKYLAAVNKGEAKINAGTLFPYDIIERYTHGRFHFHNLDEDPVLEAQWKALPNYLSEPASAIVIADTSGSMEGRPLCTSLGLAIYFAERNKGPYHNLWMSFSEASTIHTLKGATLTQKLASIKTDGWGFNTNLERAFDQILKLGIENSVSNDDMVKSIIIVSDMQIDEGVSSEWSFYTAMRKKYKKYGYDIPNVVFWNCHSTSDVFHADKKRRGVQFCSGQSAATFKHLMESIGSTPMEMMLKVLNSPRYAPVAVEK